MKGYKGIGKPMQIPSLGIMTHNKEGCKPKLLRRDKGDCIMINKGEILE